MTQYLFKTSGEYSAFVKNGNVFDKNLNWIGVLHNGNEVYDIRGKYLGFISSDERLVGEKLVIKPSISKPRKPMKPLRPLRPLRKLRMLKLPFRYFDVLEKLDVTNDDKILDEDNNQQFAHLIESEIVANDGTLIGKITKNNFDYDSIWNTYGAGSPYGQNSLFNPYGPYGSPYGASSPFNPYSATPPSVKRFGNVLGYLTVNSYISNKIDTREFMKWVETQK